MPHRDLLAATVIVVYFPLPALKACLGGGIVCQVTPCSPDEITDARPVEQSRP